MEQQTDSNYRFPWELLINGAFEHIGSQIFGYLSMDGLEELAKCREVCKLWHTFIRNQNYWYRQIVAKVKCDPLILREWDPGKKYSLQTRLRAFIGFKSRGAKCAVKLMNMHEFYSFRGQN